MKEKLIAGYWRARFAGMDAFDKFRKEETGASNMIEIVILIVIILAVAGIFRTQLMGLVNNVFEKLTEFVG